MKKRSLKSLALNKESIATFHETIFGGAVRSDSKTKPISDPLTVTNEPLPLTVDINDCPDNSLAGDCSLGYCPESFWC